MTTKALPNRPGSRRGVTATGATGTATRGTEKHEATIGGATHCQRTVTTACHTPTLYVGSGGSNAVKECPTLVHVPLIEIDETAPLPPDIFEALVGAMADMLVAEYKALTEPSNGSPTGSNHGR